MFYKKYQFLTVFLKINGYSQIYLYIHIVYRNSINKLNSITQHKICVILHKFYAKSKSENCISRLGKPQNALVQRVTTERVKYDSGFVDSMRCENPKLLVTRSEDKRVQKQRLPQCNPEKLTSGLSFSQYPIQFHKNSSNVLIF